MGDKLEKLTQWKSESVTDGPTQILSGLGSRDAFTHLKMVDFSTGIDDTFPMELLGSFVCAQNWSHH